jgi:putative transposase
VTVIVDDHSRAVPGYTVFLGDPTALQTALALRQAIWRQADPAWSVRVLPAALQRFHQRPHGAGLRRREGAADLQHTGTTPPTRILQLLAATAHAR